jgi:hypothetical protein
VLKDHLDKVTTVVEQFGKQERLLEVAADTLGLGYNHRAPQAQGARAALESHQVLTVTQLIMQVEDQEHLDLLSH